MPLSLRILFCTHAPADERTAVYRTIVDRAKYLRSQGHQVSILTPTDLTTTRIARLDPLILPWLLAPRVAGHDVVIFHSYLGWVFHWLRRWFDPRKRVATVTSFHGLEPLYHQALADELARRGQRLSARFRLLHRVILPKLLKLTCRRSDAVFCLNSNEATYLTRHAWADPERIRLVANGVAPECFVTRTNRPAVRRLLFVGQWLPAKGIHYLAEAFASVAADSDVELVCAGTGAPPHVVVSAFPASVRERVTVVPSMNREQLFDELTRADVFLFPSLSEGFSCALLEALAAGLPTIATPAGAACDLLKHGENALVIPLADASALAATVRRLLADRPLRDRLSAAARETARRFTANETCDSFATEVMTAASNRPASGGVVPLVSDDVVL